MEKAYQNIVKAVDKYRDLMVDAVNFMWDNPETGFREWKANAYLIEKYEALGYELTKAGNIVPQRTSARGEVVK